MGFIVTPSYSDIFDDKPEFSQLIADIPTKIVIIFGALINAELYNAQFESKKQAEILKFVTARFPLDIKKNLFSRLSQFMKGKEKATIVVFAKRHTIEFFHRTLLQNNPIESDDTTPLQEVNLFKAYVLAADELNKKVENVILKVEDEPDHYIRNQKFVWPLYIHQIEVNHSPSIHFQIYKLVAFLKYLKEHSLFTGYLDKYLEKVGEKLPINFAFTLITVILRSFKRTSDESFIRQFSFIKSEANNTLLTSLSLDVDRYVANSDLQVNYKGLKERPLFEYQPNAYAALSYDLLYNRVYNGFVFDFYNNSGIKSEQRYSQFPKFKEEYAKDFSEVQLFRTLLRLIFNAKHTIIEFSKIDGAPDCYVRQGNDIFLIEFKDYLVSDEIVKNIDYQQLKKHLDNKFVENEKLNPKGVRQLINQITGLAQRCFDFDNFEEKEIKKRNITVYPIIIHTNHIYTMPGINDYLNSEFKRQVKPHPFHLKELVLIELETLFRFLEHFQSNRKAFKNSLDRYLRFHSNRVKKYLKHSDVSNFVEAFCSFEDAIPQFDFEQSRVREPAFIREIFGAFRIVKPDNG